MAKQSAGILLFRDAQGDLQVLLAHPGGPFWARKDAGSWTIPKGEMNEGADALKEARREFTEETGKALEGTFIELTPVRQAGGKLVRAWALKGDFDPAYLRSNTFSLEWPPRSGQVREFPEVDRVAWFSIDSAREKINPAQAGLLDQLVRLVADTA